VAHLANRSSGVTEKAMSVILCGGHDRAEQAQEAGEGRVRSCRFPAQH